MSPRLPPLAQRLLALAILVVVLALGWFGAVQPVLAERSATRLQIEQTRELLARYQAHQRRSPGARSDARALAAGRPPPERHLPRQQPARGHGRSAARRERRREEQGGDLLSIQILPERAEAKLDAAAVRVQFRADVETVTRIFYAWKPPNPICSSTISRSGRAAARAACASYGCRRRSSHLTSCWSAAT